QHENLSRGRHIVRGQLVALATRHISRRMTRNPDARSSNQKMARRRKDVEPGINMPLQRQRSPTPKPKERPASKGEFTWARLETGLAARPRGDRSPRSPRAFEEALS